MTSQIQPSTIDTSFPVAGKDNSSQGFRDNFKAIQTALGHAESEITALQTYGIFSADITNTTPTPIVNNLLGSVLFNGATNQLNPVFYSVTTPANGNVTVDLSNGPVQKFTVSNNVVFSFIHWPTPTGNLIPGIYSTIRLILKGDGLNGLSNNGAAYTVGFNNSTGHIWWSNSQYVAPTLQSSPFVNTAVVEIFSYDGGTNIYVRNVHNDFKQQP